MKLIPAIQELRGKLPFRFDTLFSPSILKKLNLQKDSISCADLEESDTVFGCLILK